MCEKVWYDKQPVFKHRPAIILVCLTSISLILIFLNLTRQITTCKNFVYYLLFPTSELASKIINQSEQISSGIVSIVQVKEENRLLKEKLKTLTYIKQQYQNILDENNRLRRYFLLSTRLPYNLISARIISRDPNSWFRSVIIDKGKDVKIRLDSPVITFVDNRVALVGRIVEVNRSSTKVLLITDSLSSVPVKIVRSNEDGLVQGIDGPKLTLDYLFPDADIRLGDEIITSGIGEVFPEGLPVGYVKEIFSPAKTYFKQATLEPAVRLNKLREIFVLQR